MIQDSQLIRIIENHSIEGMVRCEILPLPTGIYMQLQIHYLCLTQCSKSPTVGLFFLKISLQMFMCVLAVILRSRAWGRDACASTLWREWLKHEREGEKLRKDVASSQVEPLPEGLQRWHASFHLALSQRREVLCTRSLPVPHSSQSLATTDLSKPGGSRTPQVSLSKTISVSQAQPFWEGWRCQLSATAHTGVPRDVHGAPTARHKQRECLSYFTHELLL